MTFRNAAILAVFAATTLFGQYKTAAGPALPAEASAFAAAIGKGESVKITKDDGSVYAEVWLRESKPTAGKNTEEGVTLTDIAHGALLGIIHFPAKAADRRGQGINPGYYTLRLSFHPVNGDHQGAAPQRDFALLTPIALDTDPNATPNFDTLVGWAKKASGTPHPAVLSMWKVDSDFKPGFTKVGEDWVLQGKVDGTPVGIILIGKAEG